MYLHQELTHKIIAAAIEVHKNLGPGLLESAYRLCFCLELENQGLKFATEINIPLLYKGRKINHCFRLDFIIEEKIVLELKSVEAVLPVHEAQLLTYLRLSGKELGLLINFNVSTIKQGIRRCILTGDHKRSSNVSVGNSVYTEEGTRR